MASSFYILAALCFAMSANAALQCESGVYVNDHTEIQGILVRWNETVTLKSIEAITAEWAWASNLTDYNLAIKNAKNSELAELFKTVGYEAACVNCTNVCDPTEARRVKSYQTIDLSALPAKIYSEYLYVQSTMEDIYGKAKVCPEDGSPCSSLEPELTQILAYSRDYCELEWAWHGWRNESGKKMRGYFTAYVHLQNEAAVANGFDTAKSMWTKSYLNDEENFYNQVAEAWDKILPLYKKLHAYVRKMLRAVYGTNKFPTSGHIPAHLLGNMWAQDWTNIFELVVPKPNAPAIDITNILIEQGYDAKKLFDLSDDFFKSIGMDPMTDTFWKNSIITKPEDREMICHASAWDFYQQEDFRIKQCTEVDQTDFQTIHHEMGHIQYFMQYKDQPIEFRNGANPGFHEAIGDLIALSVMTPDHLKTIGLLDSKMEVSEDTYLNSMMNMALKKIAFLPFGYVLDQYRWNVFEKKTSFSDLNADWWKLRCDMQGLSSPVTRSEDDFDPGAKYHVPASVPYIRYFFSHVVQFQFHVAICKQMGFKDNFHKCDIYGNSTATKGLREAMALGQSVPYPEVLKLITENDKLDASDYLAYFKPLEDFLDQAIAGETLGWTLGECPKPVYTCPKKAPKDSGSMASSQLLLVAMAAVLACFSSVF